MRKNVLKRLLLAVLTVALMGSMAGIVVVASAASDVLTKLEAHGVYGNVTYQFDADSTELAPAGTPGLKRISKNYGVLAGQTILQRADDGAGEMVFEVPADIGGFDVRTISYGGSDAIAYWWNDNYGKITVSVSDSLDGAYINVPISFYDARTRHELDPGHNRTNEFGFVNTEPLSYIGVKYLKISTTASAGGYGVVQMIDSVTVTGQAQAGESVVANHDDYTLQTDLGYGRTDAAKDNAYLYYKLSEDEDVSAFYADLMLKQGGETPVDGSAILAAVSDSLDGDYTGVTLSVRDDGSVRATVGETDYANVQVYNDEAFPAGSKYLRLSIPAAVANTDMYVKGVTLYNTDQPTIKPVESVTIENDADHKTFVAGDPAGLAMSASRLPEDASYVLYSYKAYDSYTSETENTPSTKYTFDGTVLKGEHDGTENDKVYVVAYCGGVASAPVEITVAPKPDPTAVTIDTVQTSLVVGKALDFAGTVAPVNANSKDIEWTVWSDADCTQKATIASFENNVLTATDNGTVYVRAKVGVVSAVKEITVLQYKELLVDQCEDLSMAFAVSRTNGVDDLFSVAQDGVDTFKRSWTELGPNYAANGPLGDMKDNDDKLFTQYQAPYIEYKLHADLEYFSVDALVLGIDNTQVLVYGSADGETYVNIPVSVLQTGVTPSGISKFTYTPADEIPGGLRYVRVYSIGQVTVVKDGNDVLGGTVEDISQIKYYHNVYCPFIDTIELYANENATVAVAPIRVAVKNDVMEKVTNAAPYELKLSQWLSTAPNTEVEITDYTDVEIIAVENGDFVTVEKTAAGIKFVLKDTFDGTMTDFVYRIKIGETTFRTQYKVALAKKVTNVTITAPSEYWKKGRDYMTLGITIDPADATNKEVVWKIVEGENGTIMQDGKFRSMTNGTFKIQATVDGVDSNVLTIIVNDDGKAPVIPDPGGDGDGDGDEEPEPVPEEKGCSGVIGAGSAAAASALFGVAALLIAKKHKNGEK